ncbi:hypothetical protein MKK58_25555 [Methylobacterium sp. J-078]|nr:hypothetical protein [Methylobacterium sp. J-078]
MEFNLRGDLAKLDSSALNDRIEQFFAEYERLRAPIGLVSPVRAPFLPEFTGRPRSRGPFRALIFYQIILLIGGEFYWTRNGRLYIIECELKDMLDECQRRIDQGDQ